MKKCLNLFSIASSSLILCANLVSCSNKKINDYTYNQVFLNVYNNVFNNVVSIDNKNIVNKQNGTTIDENFLSNKQGYSFFLSPLDKSDDDSDSDDNITTTKFFNQKREKIDEGSEIDAYVMADGYKEIFAQGSIVSLENYGNAFNSSSVSDITSFQTSLDSLAEKLEINPNYAISYDDKSESYVSDNDNTVFYDFSSVILNVSNGGDSLFYYANFNLSDDEEKDSLKDSDDDNDDIVVNPLYYNVNETLEYTNVFNKKTYSEKAAMTSTEQFKIGDLKDRTIIDNTINFTSKYNTVSEDDQTSSDNNSIYIDLQNNDDESLNLKENEKKVESDLSYFFNASDVIENNNNFYLVNEDNSVQGDEPEPEPEPEPQSDFLYRCKLSTPFMSDGNEIDYIDIHYTQEVE